MESVAVKVNSGILTVLDSEKNVVNFDLEGRPMFATLDSKTYRRGFNNRLIQMSWNGEERIVSTPGNEEADSIIARIMAYLGNLGTSGTESGEISLAKLSGRDVKWLKEDASRFSSLYRIYPILPPDASHSVYFEGSYGAKWNLSTVTSSHLSREFQFKTQEELEKHADDLKQNLGEGIRSRKGIFLGDANIMNMDQKLLLWLLDLLKSSFSLPVMASFDMYTTPKKKNMIHFRDMKDHGLDRVTVFIESGSYKVLRLFNEHTNATETLNLVNNLKDSGLNVTIVAMIGTGGKEYSKDHEEGTSNVISQMPLESQDRIYLSPMVEEADPWYVQMESSRKITRMTYAEKLEQMASLSLKIKESFRGINGTAFPGTLANYDLREAIY
jgi:hypothetical protein